MRVMLVDEIDLPRAMPVLELLLAGNRTFHVPEQLEMDEPVDAVARGKAGQHIVTMLPKPRDEVGSDTYIQRAVGPAREDVDARLALFPHGPERAAKWVLKQVQDDEEGMELGLSAAPVTHTRHAELVSASIAPPAQVLQVQAASAACPSTASAQTEGWVLKQVQDDGVFEVVA